MAARLLPRLLLSALVLPSLAVASACLPAPTPPPNDNFAGATLLAATASGKASGTTVGATRQVGEPMSATPSTVWFRWTAPVSGAVSFAATGALPAAVEPFTGAVLKQLRPVAADEKFPRAVFRTVAGTVYRLRVTGFSGGAFALKWSTSIAPVNDHLAAAAPLNGPSGSLVGDSTAATTDPTDPAVEGSRAAATLWYRWTAPASGWYDFDTSGSRLNTALGVYTDTAPLTLVDDSTGGCDGLAFFDVATAGLSIQATAGTSYVIMVGASEFPDAGSAHLGGPVQLNWRPEADAPVASGNDVFAAPANLTRTNGSVSADTRGATAEAGEPAIGMVPARSSVWFSWTPPLTADYSLTASPDDADGCGAALAVYTGTSLPSLKAVPLLDDDSALLDSLGSAGGLTADYGDYSSDSFSSSDVRVHLTAGITYRIAADRIGAPGPFTLHWDVPQAAPVIRSATPGNGSVGVIWSPPKRTAGSALTGYIVIATSADDNYDGGEPQTLPANASFTNIRGLHNGTAYRLMVAAVNSAGPGAFAVTRPVIPGKVK